jgi:hypothetical protein
MSAGSGITVSVVVVASSTVASDAPPGNHHVNACPQCNPRGTSQAISAVCCGSQPLDCRDRGAYSKEPVAGTGCEASGGGGSRHNGGASRYAPLTARYSSLYYSL